MIYLTYNDQPSGIYNSQVIDVVKYMNSIQTNERVKLIALISVRSYFTNRRKIKQRLPEAKVLPMVPKPGLWRLNYFILSLLASDKKIMARGPFAASLALRLKRAGKIDKVIFDARGAYKAELNEYDVVQNETIKKEIAEIEKDVVMNSDMRLAISEALVNYWKKEFNYDSDTHIVIPCTLSNDLVFDFPEKAKVEKLKTAIGFKNEDVVIVYSGSSAGWQSFPLVEKLLSGIFEKNPNIKLLWLTDHFDENSEFVRKYKDRIKRAWVRPEEVKNYLMAADHGILFRESTVTNQVASPVKFAEYLSCGLDVIISEHLGDFSEFVKKNACGSVGNVDVLSSVDHDKKLRNHRLASDHLTKQNYKGAYLKLLQI